MESSRPYPYEGNIAWDEAWRQRQRADHFQNLLHNLQSVKKDFENDEKILLEIPIELWEKILNSSTVVFEA